VDKEIYYLLVICEVDSGHCGALLPVGDKGRLDIVTCMSDYRWGLNW
jgi:hypothetical protein